LTSWEPVSRIAWLQGHLLVGKLDAGLGLERLRDIAGSHGAEELALLADAYLDTDGAAVDLREKV
jgi:hypothetical protein